MSKKDKSIFDHLRTKSWKREASTGLFVVLIYFANMTLRTEDVALMESRMRVLELLVYPIFLFAAGAFGMHSFTSQYLPNKAQTTRLEKLPASQAEIDALTPPSAQDMRDRGL